MGVLLILALILAVVVGFWILSSILGFVLGLALTIALGGLIGWAAGSVLGYKRGPIFSIGAGLLGAVLGTVLANILNAPKGPTPFDLPLLWTIIGSVAVVAVAKVVAPKDDLKRLGGGSSGLLR
jgi:uncharacterized membrane protein YeaQ/YmgE (transglycosylase-associated protein family)